MSLHGEIGRTARTFFDALKKQPLSLALVVMNGCLLIFLFYTEARYSDGRRIAFQAIVAQQENMAKLLVHCLNTEDLRQLLPKPQGPPPP
jgi:hypothetical protein